MTDQKTPRKRRRAANADGRKPDVDRGGGSLDSDDAERALGRAVAVGIPVAALLGAILAGVLGSLGSALLVLAAGALVGTIGLLWASVRTLSGDAPLAAGLELQTNDRGDLKALLEEKRRALRALKDLESEHALGKIDDGDYAEFAAQYRDEAKRILKAIDDMVAPYREKAEKIAEEYLANQGVSWDAANEDAKAETPSENGSTEASSDKASPTGSAHARLECTSCKASNEADAAFCKQCGTSMRAKTPSEEGNVSA